MQSNAIFVGDANLREEEWTSAIDRIDIKDVWQELGADPKTRWTWRGLRSKARFDRAWISSDLEATSFSLLGNLPTGSLLPSDHIGISISVITD